MPKNANPIYIGDRTEMMVDDFLVFETFGTSFKLAAPMPAEIAIQMDKPYEGPGSGAYVSVFHDGEKFRMYYRATGYGQSKISSDGSEKQYNCLAVSSDGIHWEKPDLGLYEYDGSKNNNIIFSGRMAHNFSPMLDANSDCLPGEKFKAVAGHAPEGLVAYRSEDGLHWEPLQNEPVITKGAFDSQNLCFYDVNKNNYRCYSRYFGLPSRTDIRQDLGAGTLSAAIRCIQSCTSDDFRTWSEPEPNKYADNTPNEQFYTNATILCPGAPHHYLSFPMRFLSERHKVKEHMHPGISDAVFMSSRDGLHFDRRFLEAWIRPNLSPRTWTQRNLITAWGILETSPEEFSLYVGEHYEWDDMHIRRYVVRRHGFASMNAPYSGGMFVTKPIIFKGNKLTINYATSAPGSIRAGIVADETGWPAPGFSAEDCDVIYGNELDKTVTWKGSSDLSRFSGKPVRLKFVMKDADLYSFRFRE